MWVTDFEQLFARSKNLPRCYDTIMFVIDCSETLFDLQTCGLALAQDDSAGSRYVFALFWKFLRTSSQNEDESASNQSDEHQLVPVESPQAETKVLTLRRSSRKRKPLVKYSPSTDSQKKPKASTDMSVSETRPVMISSTKFTRAEDYNITKLFLQLGPDWNEIKSKMSSSRSKDSLKERWMRLQEGIRIQHKKREYLYVVFSELLDFYPLSKAQRQIASMVLQDYEHAVNEAQREYYAADQNGNYL